MDDDVVNDDDEEMAHFGFLSISRSINIAR